MNNKIGKQYGNLLVESVNYEKILIFYNNLNKNVGGGD